VDYRWRAANNNWFYPKILPLSYYEGYNFYMTYYLKYLLIVELRFDTILYSKWVTKIVMRPVSNVQAGRKFPTPVLKSGV